MPIGMWTKCFQYIHSNRKYLKDRQAGEALVQSATIVAQDSSFLNPTISEVG